MGTFVNSGWIRGADPSPDGRHVLVSGISNSRNSHFFAVLDAARPGGRSPEPPGSPTECLNCPEGSPLQYVVFPRSDVSTAHPFPAAGPTVITDAAGNIRVHVLSSGGPNIADTIYDFATAAAVTAAVAPYELRAVTNSDSYWEWHRRLEDERTIDHPAAECPHRRGIELQQWTPATGWVALPAAVR